MTGIATGMRIETGTQLGGYTILSRLGRGGMATVYLAREAELDRVVALKVLPEQLVDDQDFSKRGQLEARVIASLDHPNIIPLYRYGIAEDVPWMALRYVDGGDFESALKSGMDVAAGMAVLRGVAAALDYAHRRGIVHRDLKPQNILLTEDKAPYLADFGVAKLLEGAEKLKTATGNIFGTPAYMAPEQAKGEALGPFTDIYALAVIACRVLTGYLPFDADTPHAILLKHISAPLPPPVTSTLPGAVATALALGLAKEPAARPASAGALIEAIEQALAGQPMTPPRFRSEAPVAATQLTPLPPTPAATQVTPLPPMPVTPASVAATQVTPLPQAPVVPAVAATPMAPASPPAAAPILIHPRRPAWMIGAGVAAFVLLIAGGVAVKQGWGSDSGFFAFSSASPAADASAAASPGDAAVASPVASSEASSSGIASAPGTDAGSASSPPAAAPDSDASTSAGSTDRSGAIADDDAQPSFDCSRASSHAEQLICTSPELAHADRLLQQTYDAALQVVVDKEGLKRSEIDWIRNVRDICTDAPCLESAYENRMEVLAGFRDRDQ